MRKDKLFLIRIENSFWREHSWIGETFSTTEIGTDLPAMISLLNEHATLAFLKNKSHHAFNFSSNKWDFFHV